MARAYFKMPDELGGGVVKGPDESTVGPVGKIQVYVPNLGYLDVPWGWLRRVELELPEDPGAGAYLIVGGEYDATVTLRRPTKSGAFKNLALWWLNDEWCTWEEFWDEASGPGTQLVKMIPDPDDAVDTATTECDTPGNPSAGCGCF